MSKQPPEQFEKSWREWLDRPTELTPKMAAQRVQGRLEPQPRRHWQPPWRPLLAAAALLALALVGIWRFDDRPTAIEELPPTAALLATAKPSASVLIIQLDSETPLYLTLAGDRETPTAEPKPGDLL